MIRFRALLVAATLITTAACGASSSDAPKDKDLSTLSAKAILAKAKAQVGKEAHVSIASAGSGTSSGSGAVKFDYSGKDSYGTITTPNGVLTLLNVGGTTYYKADDSFWKSSAGDQAAAIIAKLNGRWIKPAAGSSFSDFLKVADRSSLSSQVLAPQGSITKAGTKNVNGVSCVVLKDGSIGSLFVAKKGARPIQITSKANGILNFSYDAVDIPDAPAADEQVDESELSGGA
jgi:hypothetical protein